MALRARSSPGRVGVRKRALRCWFTACPLFRKCTDAFIDKLVDVCERQVIEPDSGPVFSEGEEGETMYIISSGIVEVSLGGTPATRLDAGDFFGEINLLGITARRTSTVTPLTVVDVSYMRRGPFLALMQESPEEAGKIKKEADKIFFSNKAAKVLRQRGDVDEGWDIFKQPLEAEPKKGMSHDRAHTLKDLISVVLTKVGCDVLNPELKHAEQRAGLTPVPPTPRPFSSRAGASSQLSMANRASPLRSHMESTMSPRTQSAPSSQQKGSMLRDHRGMPLQALPTPRAQSAPSSQQQTLGPGQVPLPDIADNFAAPRTVDRLASTKYASTSFERYIMRDLGGRPDFPTADFLRPQSKGMRSSNLISLYQHASQRESGSKASGASSLRMSRNQTRSTRGYIEDDL